MKSTLFLSLPDSTTPILRLILKVLHAEVYDHVRANSVAPYRQWSPHVSIKLNAQKAVTTTFLTESRVQLPHSTSLGTDVVSELPSMKTCGLRHTMYGSVDVCHRRATNIKVSSRVCIGIIRRGTTKELYEDCGDKTLEICASKFDPSFRFESLLFMAFTSSSGITEKFGEGVERIWEKSLTLNVYES